MLRRLHRHHPTCLEVENKIRAIEAGSAGESYVDNFLKQVNFPKHYAILKDLHIPISPHNYLQVDTLILTRKYIAVLEIKNIRGKLLFKKNPDQLIRVLDEESTAFKCPEQQIKRHVNNLQTLLHSLKIDIPILKALLFSLTLKHMSYFLQKIRPL